MERCFLWIVNITPDNTTDMEVLRTQPPALSETLLTIKEAAARVGIHYWKLRRAVKQGIIPSYTLFNSRRLVKLSEVVEAIEASRCGGDR